MFYYQKKKNLKKFKTVFIIFLIYVRRALYPAVCNFWGLDTFFSIKRGRTDTAFSRNTVECLFNQMTSYNSASNTNPPMCALNWRGGLVILTGLLVSWPHFHGRSNSRAQLSSLTWISTNSGLNLKPLTADADNHKEETKLKPTLFLPTWRLGTWKEKLLLQFCDPVIWKLVTLKSASDRLHLASFWFII